MDESLPYDEVQVEIHDHHVKKVTNKKVSSINVLSRNNIVEGATWEVEADMKSYYPYLFPIKVSYSY